MSVIVVFLIQANKQTRYNNASGYILGVPSHQNSNSGMTPDTLDRRGGHVNGPRIRGTTPNASHPAFIQKEMMITHRI